MDSDGTVVKVEFYEGANKIGEDSSTPYSFSWNNARVRNYSLTARAIDNDSAIASSGVVDITVTNAPPPPPEDVVLLREIRDALKK